LLYKKVFNKRKKRAIKLLQEHKLIPSTVIHNGKAIQTMIPENDNPLTETKLLSTLFEPLVANHGVIQKYTFQQLLVYLELFKDLLNTAEEHGYINAILPSIELYTYLVGISRNRFYDILYKGDEKMSNACQTVLDYISLRITNGVFAGKVNLLFAMHVRKTDFKMEEKPALQQHISIQNNYITPMQNRQSFQDLLDSDIADKYNDDETEKI
jgi:hypothetical protein